jgi:uncharacterized membrane protein
VNLPSGQRYRRYSELVGTDVGRLLAISDGIFAVGMTLLVLNLSVPALGSTGTETGLLLALARLAPSMLIYSMSFVTLGIFWFGQGAQLGQLARSDRNYTWFNLGFLLAVTMIPFSTGLLAHNPTLRVALVEYWLNIVVMGLFLFAGLEYAHRAHLFQAATEREAVHLIRGRFWIAQALYAAATALCLVFPTWVSIGLIILIQLNYVFAPRIPFLHRF